MSNNEESWKISTVVHQVFLCSDSWLTKVPECNSFCNGELPKPEQPLVCLHCILIKTYVFRLHCKLSLRDIGIQITF